jgi:hypothetical protein
MNFLFILIIKVQECERRLKVHSVYEWFELADLRWQVEFEWNPNEGKFGVGWKSQNDYTLNVVNNVVGLNVSNNFKNFNILKTSFIFLSYRMSNIWLL